MPASQTSILNIIMTSMADHLTDKLISEIQDNIDPKADAEAGLVIAGKLQSDPTVKQINIIIKPGDDEWAHQLMVPDDLSGMRGRIYEIGSSTKTFNNRRRFYVELKLFFVNEYDVNSVRERANLVLSRAENALWTQPLNLARDSFGESVWDVEVNQSFIRQGGGPGIYTWRGKIWYTVFTHTEVEITS